ncbi:MAG TPA: thiamine phosphate synthase [Candidatus Omnitrophota bacterium]|nr:thiamine phosphate synthase [Candidatus Omnitrophota bacterium]
MGWQENVFRSFSLYAVTDLAEERGDLFRKVEQAFRGGTDIVQLRSKVLTDAVMLRAGLRIRKIAARFRKLFFVNDRVDLALAAGADGVHLGQGDLPVPAARQLIREAGRKLWIGKSTHNLRQALEAQREKADYIGVGAVFTTPTKPDANALGLKFVRQVAGSVRIPWVAIGGIDLENVRSVMNAGATRVAVVRALFAAKDTGKAAQQLKDILKG